MNRYLEQTIINLGKAREYMDIYYPNGITKSQLVAEKNRLTYAINANFFQNTMHLINQLSIVTLLCSFIDGPTLKPEQIVACPKIANKFLNKNGIFYSNQEMKSM